MNDRNVKKFIRDLKERDHVQSVFLVAEKSAGVDRNGKTILSVTLTDASGHLNGRMFEKAEGVAETFEIGDVVWIKGFVQLFQNRKQVILHEIRKALDGEYAMSDLIANLAGDPKRHLAELLENVRALQNKFVREILVTTLEDVELRELLLKAPAAKTIHHAYRGGLIEHIHSIVRVMHSLAQHYPFLKLDFLVFGAIYHDLGKIYELDLSEGIHYTQSGRLVGHMVLACEMIERYAARIADFPKDLLDVLKHIVLAHHGRLEYGSPKLPMLPEAIIVAMVDDMDSKMNTLFHFLKSEADSVPATEKWSHYHPGFERHFFLEYFRQQVKTESP